LENLYHQSLQSYQFGINQYQLNKNLTNYKKLISPTANFLLINKQKGKNVSKNTQILNEINHRLSLIEEAQNKNHLNLAEILLASVKELVEEVRRL
jgi:hypothetical protein